MKLLILILKSNKRLSLVLLLLFMLSVIISASVGSTYYYFPEMIEKLKYELLVILYVCSIFTMAFGITPTTFVSIASGFMLGWQALIPVVLAYMLASIIGYYTAKKIDKGNLQKTIEQEPKLLVWYNRIGDRSFLAVFFAKISPIIPFAVGNFLLSAINIKLKVFFAGSLLGMLPRTCLALWTGIQLDRLIENEGNLPWADWLILVLLVISILGFYFLFKKRNPA